MQLNLKWLATISLAVLSTVPASAATLISDNFATFADGDLAGQMGYTQTGANSTSPIQVSGGRVTLPAIAPGGTEGQDVFKSLGTSISTPGAGTTSTYVGFNLAVLAASPTSSYFFGMDLASDGSGFDNIRLTARPGTAEGTFQFGARVTGQGGFPFAFGGDLIYGQFYSLTARINQTAGIQNDSVDLFVNALSEAAVPYATSVYSGSGAGTDPETLGAVIISQFANAGTGQAGVEITDLRVATTFAEAVVPETNTFALSGLGILPLAAIALRRRKVA